MSTAREEGRRAGAELAREVNEAWVKLGGYPPRQSRHEQRFNAFAVGYAGGVMPKAYTSETDIDTYVSAFLGAVLDELCTTP